VVEDSATVREFLVRIIHQDGRFRVLGAAASGEEALQHLRRWSPDVICLDIRLPGMNGFEVTRHVMTHKPTPIVVCSASVESDELRITMNALRAGALSVVEKPVGTTHEDYRALADRLCSQLAVMSRVKVVRQWASTPRSAAGSTNAPIGRIASRAFESRIITTIGIVASTGGPSALTTILGSLPFDFPIPIVVVQHITASFLDGFVDWLDSMCDLKVVKGEPGMVLQAEHVYVAPPNTHVMVNARTLRTTNESNRTRICPSGDVLLQSMADTLGERGSGVVLTGMGDDGAAGLLALRKAGGHTIIEDRTTAVVYGMPGAAEQMGAACESLPVDAIAARLLEFTSAGEGILR